MKNASEDQTRMFDPTPGDWKVAWTGYDGAGRKKLYGIATVDGKLLVRLANGEPTQVEVVPGKIEVKVKEGWPSLTDIKCMAYAPAMLRLLEQHMSKLPARDQTEAARIVWNVKMSGLADGDTVKVKPEEDLSLPKSGSARDH